MSYIKSNYFGRVGHIELSAPTDVLSDGTRKYRSFHGLDFKFDISKPIGAVCMDAKISILGLPWDVIMEYATYAADAVAYAKDMRVKVFAGYEKTGERCIFTGSIIRAMPTQPPEVWLEITARNGAYWAWKTFNEDLSKTNEQNVGIVEYIEKMCKYVGATCDTKGIVVNRNIKLCLPKFVRANTHLDVLNVLSRNCDRNDIVMVQTDNDIDNPHFIFSDRYSSSGFSPQNPVHVSPATGMIGIPRINWAEMEITRLLTVDGLDVCGNYLEVESRYALPGLIKSSGERASETEDPYTAILRVNNVRYRGHMRGNEWFVEYKAWRNWKEIDKGKKEETKSAK